MVMNSSQFRNTFWILLVFLLQHCSCVKRCYDPDGEIRGFCLENTLSEPGHVRLAIHVGVHDHVNGRYCGQISPDGVQSALAVRWIVDLLNGDGDPRKSFVPGIQIGYDIYDDCGLPARAVVAMDDLVPGPIPDGSLTCNTTCTNGPAFLGILSVTTPEAASVSYSTLPISYTTIRSSPHISTNIKDGTIFTSSDLLSEVQDTITLILKMKWSMVAIVYGSDMNSKAMFDGFETGLRKSDVCITFASQVDLINQNRNSLDSQYDSIVRRLETVQIEALNEKLGVLFVGETELAEDFFNFIGKGSYVIVNKLQWILPSTIARSARLKEGLQQLSDPQILSLEKMYKEFNNSFKNYFTDKILNPSKINALVKRWVDEYKAVVYSESSPSLTAIQANYRQGLNVIPTVNAILAYASSLRTLQERHCGLHSNNVCDNLRSALNSSAIPLNISSLSEYVNSSVLPEELRSHFLMKENNSITFAGINDIKVSRYDRTDSQNSFKKVAQLEGGHLEITDQQAISLMTSECDRKCDVCLAQEEIKYAYIHGDVLLLGIFTLREDGSTSDGDSTNMYTCGAYRDSGNEPITVSSFLHSVESLPKEQTGQKIGAIAIDDCFNPLNISFLLSELFAGKKTLKDPISGKKIDFDSVIAVVGALSSRVSLVIADQLTSLNIPMISYGASSSSLDDAIRYPMFLRTVPSDDFQVQGLVVFLKSLSYTHVGAVYLDDAYGQSGMRSFMSLAKEQKICVEEPQRITEDFSDSQVETLITTLQEQRVKVVLFIGIDTVAEKLLQGLTTKLGDVHFTFIASEGWGVNTQIIQDDKGKAAAGTLTFSNSASFYSDDSFKMYLANITTSTQTNNPWLRRYLETSLQCDFPGTFDKRFTKTCQDGHHFPAEKIQTLSRDQRSVHASQATFAIEKGFRQSITTNQCKIQRSRACANALIQSIKQAEVTSADGRRIRVFNEDGNGLMGFSIYNVQASQGGYIYKMIGDFTSSKELKIDKNLIKSYVKGNPPIETSGFTATCETARVVRPQCAKICPPVSTPPPVTPSGGTLSVTSGPVDDNTTTIMIAFGAVVGILLIVVILLAVLMCRQQKATNMMHKEQTLAVKAHRDSEGSLNIYAEPKEYYKGSSNKSFIHSEHAHSDSSGVASKNTSNGTSRTSRSLKVPITYSDVRQLEIPSKYGSRASIASYLSPAKGELPSIQVTQDDSAISDSSNVCDVPLRAHASVDNLNEDSSRLSYITARDLDVEDEEVDAEEFSNYPQNSKLQRPQTLPGVSPQMPLRSTANTRQTFPASYGSLTRNPNIEYDQQMSYPTSHQYSMYLDPTDDSLQSNPAMYIQGNPGQNRSNIPMILTPDGKIIPAISYQGNVIMSPTPLYNQTFSSPMDNYGSRNNPKTLNEQDMILTGKRDRTTSDPNRIRQNIPHLSYIQNQNSNSASPQIQFSNFDKRDVSPHRMTGEIPQNETDKIHFTANTLPSYSSKTKESRTHSTTSMPDVVSHENHEIEEGVEVMI